MESNDRFDKFTARARKVLTLAQEEATRFNHNYIGTEHLVLGLLREGEGVAAKVLSNLGVELNQARDGVEFIIGRGDRQIVGEIGLTPRAKKVIELAVDEARRLHHHYIGTEHLLLGLVREGEGIAAGVLLSLGVNLENLRTQTVVTLGQSRTTWRAASPSAPPPAESQSGFQARWEYLIAQVVYPETGGEGVIHRLSGPNAERFGANATPVEEALRVLGIEGWELVAIHQLTVGDQARHAYVFKRFL